MAILSNHWYNYIGYFFYNRKGKTMRKKIIALLMVAMVATLAGCGSSGTKETKKAEEKKPTYESVYKEYSQKMNDATPGLIEEYKKDAEGVSDMNKLANISAKKTEKLANICAKGGKRLAAIHTKENDDEDKYNEWMNKLTDVYQDEAQKNNRCIPRQCAWIEQKIAGALNRSGYFIRCRRAAVFLCKKWRAYE